MPNATVVFHVRRRLPRMGGNQWYKNRAEVPTNTICGAPVTGYDAAWADRHRVTPYQSTPGLMVPCEDCVSAAKAAHV